MYKPNEDFLAGLTREAVLEWLATEQNEIDWTLAHVDVNAQELDDEAREGVYQTVRDHFIKVLVADQRVDQFPYASLSILRVTADELALHHAMDEEEKAYVVDLLENGAPTFTYTASGKKALFAGLVVGAVLGLGIVALTNIIRK